MRNTASFLVTSALVLCAAWVTGCDAEVCDGAGLAQALAAAQSGDTVFMGACRVEGTFTVPAGVTLRGTTDSVIVGGVVLRTDGGTSHLDTMQIETASRGVVLEGTGDAALSDVGIRISRGVAFSADGQHGFLVERLTVSGPLDEANAAALPDRARIDQGAAYAFSIANVGDETSQAVMLDVVVRQVGPWGGLIANSFVRLGNAFFEGTVGTGLLIDGGHVELVDVSMHHLVRGMQQLPPYGVAIASGALVSAERLTIEYGEGLGVLLDASQATFVDLVIARQQRGAMRAQSNSELTIVGTSVFTDNEVAGLVVLESSIDADGLSVMGTLARRTVVGETTFADVGDGIQAELATGSVRNLTLRANARVGVLLDVSRGSLSDLSWSMVSVDGSGSALGAIAQDATGIVPSGGWDDGITRLGATVLNDASQSTLLPIVRALDTPPPPMPTF